MDQHLNFQHSFRDVVQENLISAFELLHQLVFLCDKRILLEDSFHIR